MLTSITSTIKPFPETHFSNKTRKMPLSAKVSNALTIVGTLIGFCVAASISAAGTYFRDEECDKRVPLGMILCLVGACGGIALVIVLLIIKSIWHCEEPKENDANYKTVLRFHKCLNLMHGYCMAALVYLCVQVFSTSADKCSPVLYKLGLAYCITGLVVMGLIIIIIVIRLVVICTLACCIGVH